MLQRHPELKSFLKDGDAKYYHHVTVKSGRGPTATLTIYHDDVPVEQIDFSSLETKEAMHRLLIEKGFQMKSHEYIAADQARRQRRAEQARLTSTGTDARKAAELANARLARVVVVDENDVEHREL